MSADVSGWIGSRAVDRGFVKVLAEDYVARALEMIANTAPFDISHHPAMAIPCGMSDGLPISMMLIGKHFDESTIYRAAYAFEQSDDWKSM